MPFIDRLLNLKSLSIVGMAKNTGKTETLNYILRRLSEISPKTTVGLTSIGLEGERKDQVTLTEKPEITLSEGTIFVTAEKYYRTKQLSAEILDIERKYVTSTGKLIYARAHGVGKVLIAGPPTSQGLRSAIKRMASYGADLSIIDGALSRLSLASPTVAEGLVLATGASLSAQPKRLIQQTKALVKLINLPEIEHRELAEQLECVDRGIRVISPSGEIIDPGFASALLPELWEDHTWRNQQGALYVSGAVHDNLLQRVEQSDSFTELIVRDFTRLFISDVALRRFCNQGKRIRCLNRAKLLAVTFNPQSSNGYLMDSQEMCKQLSEAIELPVYDVRRVDEYIP